MQSQHPTIRHSAIVAMAAMSMSFISAAQADGIKPGQWETSVKTNMANMPKISPEQAAQMKQMGIELPTADKPMTVQQCITPEQAKLDKPFTPQEDKDCKVNNYKHVGNKVSGDIVCTGDMKAAGKFAMTTYGDSAYKATSSIKGTSKQVGVVDQTFEITGKWLKANCDPNTLTAPAGAD